ncbi:hypothetical protein [Methanocella sp. MCL-LM]
MVQGYMAVDEAFRVCPRISGGCGDDGVMDAYVVASLRACEAM